jgi:hypothetical protein
MRYTSVIMQCEDFVRALGQVEIGNFTAASSFD